MNKTLFGAAMALGFVASTAAQAGGAWTGRAGVIAGPASREVSFKDTAGFFFGVPGAVYSNDDGNTNYGLLLGSTVGTSGFFGDLGVEVSTFADKSDLDGDGTEDSLYRSDALATVGAYLGDHWTAFAGYRHAQFGDGIFSDNKGDVEKGPFIGGGASFKRGENISVGVSLAYNFLTLEVDGRSVKDFDLNGLSAKVQGSLLGTPHSVFLRWQRFTGTSEQAGIYSYERTDDYINLGYQATFDFKSW